MQCRMYIALVSGTFGIFAALSFEMYVNNKKKVFMQARSPWRCDILPYGKYDPV